VRRNDDDERFAAGNKIEVMIMEMMRDIVKLFCMAGVFLTAPSFAQDISLPEQQDRWRIQADGSIEWKVDKRVPHSDHIEMAGEKIALWMQYGVDSTGRSKLSRTMVFPTFRLLPHTTIAHLTYNVEDAE
jgi:hypothetical protein